MPKGKFRPSNKFTKNFKKRSPFQQATTGGGMDLGTEGMDVNLVNASNREVLSRKAADVQKGIAESDQTRGFGWQAGLAGLATGLASGKEAFDAKSAEIQEKRAANPEAAEAYDEYKKETKSKKGKKISFDDYLAEWMDE